jgi:hypothetical protein
MSPHSRKQPPLTVHEVQFDVFWAEFDPDKQYGPDTKRMMCGVWDILRHWQAENTFSQHNRKEEHQKEEIIPIKHTALGCSEDANSLV